jgi:hypothetical protein
MTCRYAVILLTASLTLVSTGCPSDDLECAAIDETCAPLYQPTFDNIYSNTLVPTCAPDGRSCHSRDGQAGGIEYSDPDTAYDLLLGSADGRARVVPFDASCSLLVKRIETNRASQLMPPGDRLPEAERCAIELWIQNGAER